MAPTATYTPPPGLRTALDDFREYLNNQYDVNLTSYDTLHDFSVTRLNDFWMSVWKFACIKASVYPIRINYAVDESIPIDRFPRFFEDARMNFAENMLCGKDGDLAIISVREDSLWSPHKYTWKELRHMVAKYADALSGSGLRKGDVVALVGSNCVESLAWLLATAAVGGIFASFATDMGEKALHGRLSQLHPRLVIAESSYSYNGRQHDISTKIANCLTEISRLGRCQLVIIGSLSAMGCECMSLESFLNHATGREIEYEQVPFNTPLIVMFSSGTTGTPKGIVHSHGGLVLNGVKEHLLHNNFGPQDVHFHFSNIGWTLWNISLGALFCKTTMVLYDGSPFYPTPEEFLRAIFANGITGFGAGPRYYSELQKRNLKPKSFATKLHSILSTGAVLTPALATWLADAFGPVCQISFSGGTELSGSFLHGTRSLPSYPGEISVKELGMDVDVFSPDGKPLPHGESGELVCKKPFPNMPLTLWNDPEMKRYRASYFEAFPHVWTHGDFIRVNRQTKGIYVLGRSDGVLNPSGIRFGSSEIYNILSTPHFAPSIIDALVVGQQRVTPPYSDSTERVLLFIKCSPAASTNTLVPPSRLETRIREQIAEDLSRRHVPEFIFEVPEVPYNANGKKLEIPVKAIISGGGDAMAKLKFPKEEMRVLEWFERFFDLEKLMRELERKKTKL